MEIIRRRISYPIAFNLLILSIVLGTVVLLSSSLFSARVHAQAGDLPCMPPAYAPRQTIRLTDRIPESATTVTPNMFYTFVVTVTINSDDRICLSSSSNGRAPLKVDDLLDLQVTRADGSTAKWMYNFYDPATDGITTTTARDISGLFTTRQNQVAVLLSDLKPHRFSAEPIWLVIWKDPTATPIVVSGATKIATLPFVVSPTATAPAVFPTTVYPTVSPLTPAVTPSRQPTGTPTPECVNGDISPSEVWIIYLVAILLLVGYLGWGVTIILGWFGLLQSSLKIKILTLVAKVCDRFGWAACAKKAYAEAFSESQRLEKGISKTVGPTIRDVWLGQFKHSDPAELAQSILEVARMGGDVRLSGLAAALPIRWYEKWDLAREEIYWLAGAGCQPKLFELLSQAEFPSSSDEKVQDIIRAIREVCRILGQPLDYYDEDKLRKRRNEFNNKLEQIENAIEQLKAQSSEEISNDT